MRAMSKVIITNIILRGWLQNMEPNALEPTKLIVTTTANGAADRAANAIAGRVNRASPLWREVLVAEQDMSTRPQGALQSAHCY